MRAGGLRGEVEAAARREDGLVPAEKVAGMLVERFGNGLGERSIGYPLSWVHTNTELERVWDQLKKENVDV